MQFDSLSESEYYDRQPGEDRPVLPRRDGMARPAHTAGPPRTPEFGSSLFDPFDVSRGTYPVTPDSGMISIPLTHMNVVLSMSAAAMLQPRRGGLTMRANAAADPDPAA